MVLALWFSGTAAGPGMAREAAETAPGFQALLTAAVQAGFVAGTLASAALAVAAKRIRKSVDMVSEKRCASGDASTSMPKACLAPGARSGSIAIDFTA